VRRGAPARAHAGAVVHLAPACPPFSNAQGAGPVCACCGRTITRSAAPSRATSCAPSHSSLTTVRVKIERNITQSTSMLYQNQRSTWVSVVAVIAVAGAIGAVYVNLAFGALAVALGV
jgi:hypothetical protein